MRTLIAYMSTHGCTEYVVEELKEKTGLGTTVVDLKNDAVSDLENFDRIIIGGSIHAGQIQKRVKEFCLRNVDVLVEKEIGLFICCMYEGEVAQQQLQNAFPEKLHRVAKYEAVLGGAYNFDKMRFFEKLMVKKIAGVKESVSCVDVLAIENFAQRMNNVFNPFLFLS